MIGIRKGAGAAMLAALLLAVAACNTVAGAGRDLQSVGNTIEDAAR